MKTDDLVAALAAGVEPVPQGLVSRRLGQALPLRQRRQKSIQVTQRIT